MSGTSNHAPWPPLVWGPWVLGTCVPNFPRIGDFSKARDLRYLNIVIYIFYVISTTQILANEVTEINDKVGRRYFEGSLKFQSTLTKILNMLVNRVKMLAEKDINGAYMSQIWGVVLLVFVMILSPILIVLAKNAISSIQVFAGMYLAKEKRLKKQLYDFILKLWQFQEFQPNF